MAAGAGVMGVASIATGMLLGETDEEVERRLQTVMNPTEGRKFLAIQVGDNWYGIGGQVRAMTQMISRAVADPGGLTKKDLFDNPLTRFAQAFEA